MFFCVVRPTVFLLQSCSENVTVNYLFLTNLVAKLSKRLYLRFKTIFKCYLLNNVFLETRHTSFFFLVTSKYIFL